MTKRIFALLGCLMVFAALFAVSVSAKSGADLLVDDANLLTTAEKSEIITALNEASDAVDADIVVVTTPSLGMKSEMAFADDYYDQNGYGRGESGQDGVLLLLSMEERPWYVSSCGKCIEMVS